MTFHVQISEQADRDLKGIFEYIAFELQAFENAVRQLERFEDAISRLDNMLENGYGDQNSYCHPCDVWRKRCR